MKIPYLAPAVSALLFIGAAANAATVTFTAANIDPTSTDFLDNSGTLLSATNFAAETTGPFSSTNPDTAVTLSGIAFDVVSTTVNAAGTNFTTNSANRDNARYSNVTFANPELYGMVYSGLISGANNSNLSVTLTGLTLGETYQVQMIFSELNTGNLADRTVQIAAGTFTPGSIATSGTGSDGTSSNYNYGPTSGALLVTATFTADSETELFTTLSNTTAGNSRVTLSGLVISQVPEPSVALLGAFGGMALISRRRRA